MAQAGLINAETWAGAEVLLIEDDAYFRRLLRTQLQQLGITLFREASDGAQALYHLNRPDHPELVICDLQMPTMNGVEFLRELHLEDFRGGVLLVSGEHSRTLRAAAELARGYSLNLLGALSKPVSNEALARALRERLPAPPRGAEAGSDPAAEEPDAAVLRDALGSGAITLHYQPKVALDDARIVGIEALARWVQADGSAVAPEIVLQFAVDQQLAAGLTRRVLQTAITQLADLLVAHQDWQLAVNIFAGDLLDPDLPAQLAALANAAGCSPRQLILDVPPMPTGLLAPGALEVASQLSLRGIGLALDGRDVGFAELERLLQLPFCELKLDREFVQGAHGRPHAADVLEAQVQLAGRLGLRVVAEGVAGRADWDFVALAGCDQAQGHFIAPALPADALGYWAAWYADAGQMLCTQQPEPI